MDIINKPFSMEYVLKETIKHIQKSIDISTQKTISRLNDFEGQSEKIKEIMATLANLNRINAVVASIKDNNKELFGDR